MALLSTTTRTRWAGPARGTRYACSETPSRCWHQHYSVSLVTSITYQRWRVTYAGLGKQFSHLYNADKGAAVPGSGWVFVAEQVSSTT